MSVYIGAETVLPAGFTPLEYIEGTGSQYIQLSQSFSNTDEMYAKVAMLESTTGSSGDDKYFISPQSWNTNNNRFALGGYYKNSSNVPTFNFSYGAVSTDVTFYTPSVPRDNSVHEHHYVNKVFKIEDVGASYNVSSISWGGNTAALRLFYGYNAPTKCRIYRYWHKRNGSHICNLIPAKKNSTGEVGMYDLVSKSFLSNAGSGSFVGGGTESSKARKITSAYVGVNGVAKRIKVAYIGVNGVAKIIYGTSQLVKYQKYTITHSWGIAYLQSISRTNITSFQGYYLDQTPPFSPTADTKPKFNYNNQIKSGSLENGLYQRHWKAYIDGSGEAYLESGSGTQSDCFIILTSATKILFNTIWELKGDAYQIVQTGDLKGTYIETVNALPGTYPDNGIKDGYWWVRV